MIPIPGVRVLFFHAFLFVCLALPNEASSLGPAAASLQHISLLRPISSPYYPVVIKGRDLPPLLNAAIGKISLYAFHGAKGMEPIPFQIDRKNMGGEFLIPDKKAEIDRESKYPMGKYDELVFMASDTGEQTLSRPDGLTFSPAVEIELLDPPSESRRWVYAFILDHESPVTGTPHYVSYQNRDDVIESETYRVGFSRQTPLVIDTLIWKGATPGESSPNLADKMKARHTGKLFQKLDFVRTEEDSESRLTAVKQGPVRVIRCTVNRARLIMGLRTPAITIYNIHYANAFFMDTFIEIPFRIGLFLSDLTTLMTMDGNDGPSVPAYRVYSNSVREGADINGRMSVKKKRINASGDQDLVISSTYGKVLVSMDLGKNLPVRYRVYIMDDQSRPDPPENVPGQFGNMGFISTGWEKLDASVYHMVFSVYMIRDISVDQGFDILQNAPAFVN
ncbi:MAG: hypothetical protein AABY87_00530 [bacterium]